MVPHQQILRPQYFNPRSHTGSDQCANIRYLIIFQFQSTLPHGERLSGLRVSNLVDEFQSTLPHGERHLTVRWALKYRVISIHAPTRGATN